MVRGKTDGRVGKRRGRIVRGRKYEKGKEEMVSI